MGITLQRKDKTSIFCHQPRKSRNSYFIDTRLIMTIISFSLLAIGTWIITNSI